MVDWLIAQAQAGNTQLTRRLAYWGQMKAVQNTCNGGATSASDYVAGYNGWQCFREGLQGGYMQISANPQHVPLVVGGEPGGFLGCYWQRTTVTAPMPISSVEQVRNYMLGGRTRLHAISANPCAGCDMPRLEYDQRSVELGMDPDLWHAYREFRMAQLGY